MPTIPDPSSAAQFASQVEAGLAALKQSDYAHAIALLEAVSLPIETALGARAKIGLATAYIRSGDIVKAATLCQMLAQNSNPQVQAWANRAMEKLNAKHPHITAMQTGAETRLQIDTATWIQAGTETEMPVDTETWIQPETGGYGDGETIIQTSGLTDATGFKSFHPTTASDLSQTVTGFTPLDRLPDPIENQEPDPLEPDPLEANVLASDQHDIQAVAKPDVAGSNVADVADKKSAFTSTPASAAPKLPPRSRTPVPAHPTDYQPTWRQAGRAATVKPLGKVNQLRLILAIALTTVSLYWTLQQVVYFILLQTSVAVTKIPFLGLSRTLFSPPIWSVIIFLVLLFVSSRWLLDAYLAGVYGLKPLTMNQLGTASPEARQSLIRFCQKYRLPLPALGLLPTEAPIAFSYGCLPRFTRIVVSQGLLAQLADDEIATVFASEIGHIACWDTPILSMVTVLLQIPYTLYWVTAEWGNQKEAAVSRASARLIAALSYGVYALFRWVALWLSRQRVYYSDRIAAELTGNPNGFVRALLKIAIGTTKEIETKKQTSYLLEGFDLLMPLGHRMATTLGSLYPHTPLEPVLAWERSNPYRHWLAVNNSHPPTGDRLHLLTLYARYWKLESELADEREQPSAKVTTRSQPNSQQKSTLTFKQWRTLALQGAPFFGLVFGLVVGHGLSFIGWLAWRSDMTQFAWMTWMNGDASLLRGLPLIGFSLGTLIRINSFFPNLNLPSARTDPSVLIESLSNAAAVPVTSQPIRLEGTLLGRAGIGNDLSQDFLLNTATGMVRLHCLSRWGPIGNLLPRSIRPTDLMNQKLVVTGWFRRGATPWIDVDMLRTAGGRVYRSDHPMWSTLLAIITALWGAYTIARGSL